jgi:hypothetical protein
VLARDNTTIWGKMLDLRMLVLSSGGGERTKAEVRELVSAAGLLFGRVISTSTVTGLIEATR